MKVIPAAVAKVQHGAALANRRRLIYAVCHSLAEDPEGVAFVVDPNLTGREMEFRKTGKPAARFELRHGRPERVDWGDK